MSLDPEGVPTTRRARLWRRIEPSARVRPGLSWTNRALVVTVLISVGAAVLLTEPTMDFLQGLLRWVLAGCAAIFTVEYAARLWTAAENPRHRTAPVPALSWALRWTALLDLAALLGAWLEVATGFGLGWAVMLRLARFLEVFAVDDRSPLGRAARELLSAVRERRLEFGIAATLASMLVMLASVAIYIAEREGQPEAFGSIPRAMWWSVVTLTTVGYGDAIPATAAGRVIGAVVSLSSVALIALPAGIMAAAFSEAVQRLRRGDRR